MKNKIQPNNQDELLNIIQNEINLHGDECDLNHIDTSLIADMNNLFFQSNFNGIILKIFLNISGKKSILMSNIIIN